MSEEVVVQLDGLPRPATVVKRTHDQVLVRFRQAGGYDERWVPASDVVEVEPTKKIPVWKLVGGGLLALVGLVLVWPHGSNKPLLSSGPSPSATPSVSTSLTTDASPSPLASGTVAPHATTALLFGDSFAAGKGSSTGTPTALVVAAHALGWQSAVLAQPGTGYTTRPSYASRLAAVTNPPDVLLLEGGASDTSATSAQLTAAATSLLRSLKQRFPRTTVVLLGPVPMDQPPDQGLLRVNHTLAAVAQAEHVAYIDPAPWITPANAGTYVSSTGFYPNAAGHRYLGTRLAAALRAILRT